MMESFLEEGEIERERTVRTTKRSLGGCPKNVAGSGSDLSKQEAAPSRRGQALGLSDTVIVAELGLAGHVVAAAPTVTIGWSGEAMLIF